MKLYAGTSEQFVQDAIQNQIAEKLRSAFVHYFRYNPPPSEVQSWRNSLRAMSQVLQYAELMDHGVLLEYQLPLTSRRLDCMILGRDENGRDHGVIVELKQWETCAEAAGANEVVTRIGGVERDVLHPSVQVSRYRMYLQDTHTAFYEGADFVLLGSCAYLHNYTRVHDDVLFAPKFSETIASSPIFTGEDVDALAAFLRQSLGGGEGRDVLRRVEGGAYRPSKKLMQHVAGVIKGTPQYILLDEQLVAYDQVFALARQGFHQGRKNVVIIKGGPGTGKSVIAINLMADLLLNGYTAQYATGSKAFTETLRAVIGSRASAQFNWFNSYSRAGRDELDVLICDEAHRIRAVSGSRYVKRDERSGMSQVEELLHASRVTVFFVDDLQGVRPNEIGSSDYIRRAAEEAGCRIHEYQLEAQFRCNGSEAFVSWVNNTLGIERTPTVIWDRHEDFDFRIVSDPLELEAAIRQKVAQGYSGRVTAGFCWGWSDPNADGSLVPDVAIGGYRRAWNAKPEARRLAPGIPKASVWAYDPNGMEQVGCVYTAQGFEFDYVGVIVGPDITYDLDERRWEGHREMSKDGTVKRARPDAFLSLVKNTYRVLFTRGMKGCYVYFMDKDTERFVKSRME